MRKVEFKEPPKRELPKGEKKCPRCEKVKDIADEFGYRKYRHAVYAQSQCMKCRGMKPLCQTAKELERENKAKKEQAEIGKRIVAAAEKQEKQYLEDSPIYNSIVKKEREAKEKKQKHIWITGDKATLKVQYKQHFPNDTNNDKRAVKFMIQKLLKRLGDQAKLTPSAQKILEG